jgi:hypothetical protein
MLFASKMASIQVANATYEELVMNYLISKEEEITLPPCLIGISLSTCLLYQRLSNMSHITIEQRYTIAAATRICDVQSKLSPKRNSLSYREGQIRITPFLFRANACEIIYLFFAKISK